MPFVDTSALEVIEHLPGWYGRYFHSPSMTFAHYEFKRGSSILDISIRKRRSTRIEGGLELTIDGVRQIARPGLVGIVPSIVRHSVKALTDGRAIIVDSAGLTEFLCRVKDPIGPSVLTIVPRGIFFSERLNAVSRIRVAIIRWSSNGALTIEKVRTFPSESVSGGFNKVQSATCPGLKSKPDGFSSGRPSCLLRCRLFPRASDETLGEEFLEQTR